MSSKSRNILRLQTTKLLRNEAAETIYLSARELQQTSRKGLFNMEQDSENFNYLNTVTNFLSIINDI